MFEHLERLRSKPEAVRRRALVLASGALTLIIFLLWLLNLKYVGPLSNPVQVAAPPAANATGTFHQTLARIQAGWQILMKRL